MTPQAAPETGAAPFVVGEAVRDLGGEQTSTPDKPFNAWRIPATPNVQALASEAAETMLQIERSAGLRKRRRRASDLARFETMVSAVISDLTHLHLTSHNGWAMIPRSKKRLCASGRYSSPVFSDSLPAVLDLMARPEASLIDQEKGSWASGQQTTIRAGSWLIERIEDLGIEASDFRMSEDIEVIVLKRTKDGHWDKGKRIDYEDNQTTEAYRAEVQRINRWLADADINFDEGELEDHAKWIDTEDRTLKRYFSQSRFDCGGRLFGGFWQHLSKEERLRGVLIEEEPIVELDYGQMAPRIIYSLCHQKPTSEDLYAVSSFENHRAGIKKVMNSMLFSEKRLQRMPKGGRELFKKWHRVEEVMLAIEQTHPFIKDAFFTGIGHQAQFIESEVLVDVLLDLMDQGITALPIHDAVLVPASRQEEARATMLATFKQQTGLEGIVEVKGFP